MGLLKAFFPFRQLVEESGLITKNRFQVEKNLNVDYNDLRHKFFTEYGRTNPITKIAETKDFYKFMRSKSNL